MIPHVTIALFLL